MPRSAEHLIPARGYIVVMLAAALLITICKGAGL